MLVVLRKGGRELRFYSPRQLRLQPDVLHKFLEVDGWKETPAWTGLFAPGGALYVVPLASLNTFAEPSV